MRKAVAQPRQRGYVLLELTVVMLIAGLLSVWAAHAMVHRFNDAQAQAAAVWMRALHKAALGYIGRHAPDIQMAVGSGDLAAQGFQDWRAPAVHELTSAGLLHPGFPPRHPITGEARVSVWRGGNCPGSDCTVEGLVHGHLPILTAAGGPPDEAMIAEWLLAGHGYGATVHATDPTRLRGAAYALDSHLPNGTVLPVGTVGMAVTTEQQALWNFLRVGDPRDPDFQGRVSVAGDLHAGGSVTLENQLVIQSQGAAGARCSPNGAVVHDIEGGLLVCRMYRWRPVSRTGGGGYGYNFTHGCRSPEGVDTGNPITGLCSCPSYANPVLLFDTGNTDAPSGRQQAYLCVG